MSGETLRDRIGNLIGRIEVDGNKRVLRDKVGTRLGEYSTSDNVTRDRNGTLVGTGDLLLTLLRP